MEFLSVGGIKLKVTLTKNECEAYSINQIEGQDTSEQARDAIRKILAIAREKATFNASGERLLIQIYPLGERGAELFITKLSAIPERERRTVAESGILTYMGRTAFYKFPDSRSIVAVSKILADRPVSLYLGGDGEYYLSVDEALIGELSDCDPLLEFGEKIHRLPLGIFTEWGRLLLEGKPLLCLNNA